MSLPVRRNSSLHSRYTALDEIDHPNEIGGLTGSFGHRCHLPHQGERVAMITAVVLVADGVETITIFCHGCWRLRRKSSPRPGMQQGDIMSTMQNQPKTPLRQDSQGTRVLKQRAKNQNYHVNFYRKLTKYSCKITSLYMRR